MDNLLTVALVVLICSIFVFFSKEFGNLIKRVFAIPGMKLFLPLILATIVVVNFDSWVFIALAKTQSFLLRVTTTLTNWLPFQHGASYIADTLLLTGLSILPVIAIRWRVKRKSYRPFQYSYLTSTVIWLIVIVLLNTQ